MLSFEHIMQKCTFQVLIKHSEMLIHFKTNAIVLSSDSCQCTLHVVSCTYVQLPSSGTQVLPSVGIVILLHLKLIEKSSAIFRILIYCI